MRSRTIKFALFGACGVAGAGLLGYMRDVDVFNGGPVRLARAGFTVGTIVADYKWSLRGMTPNQARYSEIKSQVQATCMHRLINGPSFFSHRTNKNRYTNEAESAYASSAVPMEASI